MNNLFINSAYFGLVLTLGTYMLGVWIKKKTGLAIMNPLLVSTAFVIAFLLITKVDYQTYKIHQLPADPCNRLPGSSAL